MCRMICASALACLLFGCSNKDEPTPTNPQLNPPVNPGPGPQSVPTPPLDPKLGPKVSPNGDVPAPTPKAPESLAKVRPDVIYTAEELRVHEKTDGGYLFTKHTDKVVELTGMVEHASHGGVGEGTAVYVFLHGGDGILDTIRCQTSDEAPWKKVFPGQTAVLRARPTALGLRWEIIEAKGPTPPEVTAEQLASDIAADRDAVTKKFGNKYLIVTGVIDKVDINKIGHATVKLQTEKAGTSIPCVFLGTNTGEEARNATLKSGLKLKAIGKFDSFTSGGLHACELMELTP
jgi:tRNA_anti-like